ncbi:WcaI family glycosyltransferase [Sphingomonas jatrophae]|uniref:Colanic acid biosynthesis glycosyl transferase WcaI n=1 Tax=Sphingomonas jatrophae TaxID=1166337 RepID=A0A1I6M584_9SPHN|nr:WcaI family glycosyltransferase [Sphingomonas jatrophae]SFS10885.1 colanic acid biosynthesis glycosyl transferase WcaI [Sphingomonas jatrophae]
MNILILGLNYAPEPVGIGPYTTGMATALAEAGHRVTVVAGKPYYPAWKVDPAFAGGGVRRTVEDGVRVVRVPIYVPANPNGRRRLLHHASFALRAQPEMLAEAKRAKPDLVIAIAPSLIGTVAARTTARAFGAKLWLHIQDFEVEAAFATGLLSEQGMAARAARAFERWSVAADRISTISPQMCAKLRALGVSEGKIVEFRNWASLDRIRPLEGPSPYRAEWGIDRPHVAFYSGNIANKQGIEIIVDAARLLARRRDLMFVVCGEGPNRERLIEAARGQDNIRFFDLQPMERLSDLLGMATVHLLPQIAGAADLVLPSKLTNMLASARPVIATAEAGTGLAQEVDGVGIVTRPEDAAGFAAAIEQLIDDPARCAALGAAARLRAEERWSKARILARFEQQVREAVERG